MSDQYDTPSKIAEDDARNIIIEASQELSEDIKNVTTEQESKEISKAFRRRIILGMSEASKGRGNLDNVLGGTDTAQCNKMAKLGLDPVGTGNSTDCYLCGLPLPSKGRVGKPWIFPPNQSRMGPRLAAKRGAAPECEHVLPFILGYFLLGIVGKGKLPVEGTNEAEALKLEYLWSHAACNQLKSQGEFIKFIAADDKDEKIGGYFEPDYQQITDFLIELTTAEGKMGSAPDYDPNNPNVISGGEYSSWWWDDVIKPLANTGSDYYGDMVNNQGNWDWLNTHYISKQQNPLYGHMEYICNFLNKDGNADELLTKAIWQMKGVGSQLKLLEHGTPSGAQEAEQLMEKYGLEATPHQCIGYLMEGVGFVCKGPVKAAYRKGKGLITGKEAPKWAQASNALITSVLGLGVTQWNDPSFNLPEGTTYFDIIVDHIKKGHFDKQKINYPTGAANALKNFSIGVGVPPHGGDYIKPHEFANLKEWATDQRDGSAMDTNFGKRRLYSGNNINDKKVREYCQKLHSQRGSPGKYSPASLCKIFTKCMRGGLSFAECKKMEIRAYKEIN